MKKELLDSRSLYLQITILTDNRDNDHTHGAGYLWRIWQFYQTTDHPEYVFSCLQATQKFQRQYDCPTKRYKEELRVWSRWGKMMCKAAWMAKYYAITITGVPDAPGILVNHFIRMPDMSDSCSRCANEKSWQKNQESLRFTRGYFFLLIGYTRHRLVVIREPFLIICKQGCNYFHI